jgi:hypothetical protein
VIKLFKNSDRDDDVVFLKVIEAGTVVKDDVGVEDKSLFIFGHEVPGKRWLK